MQHVIKSMFTVSNNRQMDLFGKQQTPLNRIVLIINANVMIYTAVNI